MIISILVFIIAFVGSFIFAGYETGLVSVNPIKVAHAADTKERFASLFQEILGMPSRVVATVLIGNNVALVGMQSSFTVIVLWFWKDLPDVVITSILTVLALIFCELLPKSLFRIYSYRITKFFTPFIWVLTKVLTPFTFVFDLLSNKENVSNVESVVIAELHAVASEGGRKQEINSMVAHLSESLFAKREMTVGEFLELIEELEVDVEVVDSKEIDGSFPLDEILSLENLFMHSTWKLVDSSKLFSSEKILETLLFAK